LLLSVGWLDDEHPYERGAFSAEVFRQLVRVLYQPWQPFAFAGHFPCPMCRFTGGPGGLTFEGTSVNLNCNLFIPSGENVFVSPGVSTAQNP